METNNLRAVMRSPFANSRSITRKFAGRLKYVAVFVLLASLAFGDDSVDLTRWDDTDDYDSVDEIVLSRGQIVEYSKDDNFCRSWFIPPGFSLVHKAILAFFYFGVLCFMFLGIAIVADIFMA